MKPPLLKNNVGTLFKRGCTVGGPQIQQLCLSRSFSVSEGRTTGKGSGDKPRTSPEHQRAKQDRDFILSVLDSSTNRREAKAYIQRYKPQQDPNKRAKAQALGATTAVGQTPLFSQERKATLQKEEVPILDQHVHIALVKIRLPQSLEDNTLESIGLTFKQLSKLGLTSVILVDCGPLDNISAQQRRKFVNEQADRIVLAIERNNGLARRVDGSIQIKTGFSGKETYVGSRKLLLNPLKRGIIPVLPPLGYSLDTYKVESVDPVELTIAVTKELAGYSGPVDPDEDHTISTQKIKALQEEASLDRLILLDPIGGPPSLDRSGGVHVFLNLEQEYSYLTQQLAMQEVDRPVPEAQTHIDNLRLLKEALSYLPRLSSAILTTPQEAANSSRDTTSEADSSVGTRRRKNPLIHSLLTDKPMISSSLPPSRVNNPPVTRDTGGSRTTFVKKGMPVTIIPDPHRRPWTPPEPGEPTLSLKDPQVDLSRLVALIEDSFGRELDVSHYLKRIENRLAGLIIAGEYEGAAILTWEAPRYLEPHTPASRLVPYLDKFAVLRKSQGAGGVADIVFNAMVRDCFPDGVCWRSRKDNPVNKWYFERARGTWKIPKTNWTMFWTTENVIEKRELFADYEQVCRGVEPSWVNKKIAAD